MTRTNRPSARVLLVDDDGRILLFGIVDPEVAGPKVWVTPGGGVEPGEDLAAAASRELEEETGVVVGPADLGEPIAVASGDWEFRGQPMYSDDWFFLVRRSAFEPDRTGWTELEHQLHADWRWWTPDELDAADESVFPGGLADLVRDIVAGAVFEGARTLPWESAALPPMRRDRG
jgi:8-oxo-dGTP pyrophosphatase MutT (NUDIX family)